MKKVLKMMLVCFFVFTGVVSVMATPCDTTPYCHLNPEDWTECLYMITPSGNYGCTMATLKDVDAKSNGASMGEVDGEYQCAEYAKRFYKEAFGCNLYRYIGVAKNFYVKYDSSNDTYAYLRNSGLLRYPNGASAYPQPGDIFVYDHSNGVGHVAIVTSSSATQVDTIEQNWDTSGTYTLMANNLGGSYTISDRSTTYSVLGWLHMPIGEFSDGWHFDSDRQYSDIYHNLKNSRPFMVSYQNNGGRDVLGMPTGTVYEYPSFSNPYSIGVYSTMRKAWIQDFQNGDNQYSLVVNEYVLNLDKGYFGAVYPIGGQIRTYWKNNYWELGYPVSNEYLYNPNQTSPSEFTVQWFERLDEEYYVVIYNNLTGQIRHESLASTSVPMPDLSEFRAQASSYDFTEGIGGGVVNPSYNYSIGDTTICKSVQTVTPYSPIDETTVFQNSDGYVFSWIELNNLYYSVDVKFKWYNPLGSLLSEWEYTTTDPNDEGWDYWNWYRTWCWLDISNISYYGEHRVDIYINEEKVVEDFFDLTISLSVPQNLTGTFSEINETVSLNWEDVTNADVYRIFRDDSEITSVATSEYVDTTAELYTSHTYKVKAIKGNRSSDYSNVITVETGDEPVTYLDTPIGLTVANINFSTVELSWQTVENAEYYKIFRDDVYLNQTTSIDFIDMTVNSETEYSYKIQAVCQEVISSFSEAVVVTTLPFVAGIIDEWEGNDYGGWLSQNSSYFFIHTSGGNPDGNLVMENNWNFMGAYNFTEKYQGNFVSQGLKKISFDVYRASDDNSTLVYPGVFGESGYSGWYYGFTPSSQLETWVTYSTMVDPTWTDVEAQNAGWSKGYDAISFVETISNVIGVGLYVNASYGTIPHLKFDNFQFVFLSAPVGLVAVDNTEYSVEINWLGVDGADKYQIYRNGEYLAESNILSYIDIGAEPDTTYTYKVLAADGNIKSSFSSELSLTTTAGNPVIDEDVILQPGPGEGKDIWTTSVYSYAPGGGGPGGGLDDEWLKLGGWGDYYYSLIEFDLSEMPEQAQTATLQLYTGATSGNGTTGIYLDRITEFWDWTIQGTGTDYDRLWWADKPATTQWISGVLPAPTVGEWYSIDITDLYNAWQAGTYPNYGIQMRPYSVSNYSNQFYSSDYATDPTLRPKLIVVPVVE